MMSSHRSPWRMWLSMIAVKHGPGELSDLLNQIATTNVANGNYTVEETERRVVEYVTQNEQEVTGWDEGGVDE